MSEFEAENEFFRVSDPSRLAKWLGHWEVYKLIKKVPGEIIEVGVHKGNSLIRWLTFRQLDGGEVSRRVWGFDTFQDFPESDFEEDESFVEAFVRDAGNPSQQSDLEEILRAKRLDRGVTLVPGHAENTISTLLTSEPHLRVALLHIDVDTYLPTKTALELLGDRVSRGGVILLDDYGKFPGETRAWDEFNEQGEWSLEKMAFHPHVAYAIRKE